MGSNAVKAVSVVLIVVTGVGAIGVAALARRQDGTVPDGVHVAGMDWSNKPISSARAELEAWRKSKIMEPLEIALPADARCEKRWQARLSDLGADVDVEATMSSALTVRQSEGILSQLAGIFSHKEPIKIAPKWTVDLAKFKQYVAKHVSPSVRKEAQDALLAVKGESFNIIPEKPGLAVDLDKAHSALLERAPLSTADPLILPTVLKMPHVTQKDLTGIEGEVSAFQTHYSERGNRARNIIVACSHINGTVLKPGDRFSYNKVVGPRDEDSGFKMAPVIINGRLKPGMGGGVCQVSTTLYNAALLANLKIVRREHHAFPVHYVSPGRDATVAYGDKDFQFENDTQNAIAVISSGEGQKVSMRIFGKKVPGREIAIQRTNVTSWGQKIETVTDRTLPAGKTVVLDKGHAGHRATVWRIVKVGGQVVKRELLSKDYYQAFPKMVAIGTRPALPSRGLPTTPGGAIPANNQSPRPTTIPVGINQP